jgi:butyryl-CoA dehydrogenase
MGAIADMVLEVYAMESAILRAEKIIAGKRSVSAEIYAAMARIYAENAIERIEMSARKIISAVAEGDMARTQFTILRRLAKHDPADTISLRRQVAQHLVKSGKYAV